MNNDALVSICIPVFNCGPYLAEAINSASLQTHPNVEIIVVDDGSSDDSLEIAKRFACDRIRVYSQNNRGGSAARNRCLAEAKGEYIQFLDADDLLSRDKIANQVRLLSGHKGKIAVCPTVHFKDGTNPFSGRSSPYEDAFLVDASPFDFLVNLYGAFGENGSMIQPNAWLTPISVIQSAGPWNEALTLDDDGEYFCRVILNSAGVVKSEGINYYRKHTGSRGNLSGLTKDLHLHSQYLAIRLKVTHLKAFNRDFDFEKLYARWLQDLRFKAYPGNKHLVKEINNDLETFSSRYPLRNPFATPSGRFLYTLLGWKFTKRLQVLSCYLRSRQQKINKKF